MLLSLRLFLFYFAFVFCAFTAEARVCQNIFPPVYYTENVQAQKLIQKNLELSEQLSQTKNISQTLWLRLKMKATQSKFAKLFTLPENHPGPLFIWNYFYPEPFWPTIFIHGTFRARVYYLDESQRQNLEYKQTEQGLMHIMTGEFVTGPQRWILVIGLDQKIYLAQDIKELPTYFCHSSFFAGMPVLFAGILELQSNGTVSLLTNSSGHYNPSPKYLNWATSYLRSLGFKIPDSAVHTYHW